MADFDVRHWLDFISGRWQRLFPANPGSYPVATLEGTPAGLKVIFRDPSSGVLRCESAWKGLWWSEPLPELPEVPSLVSILVQDAREFAIEKHAEQRYGEQPYWIHLQMVVSVLNDFGYFSVSHPEMIAAGWLHDSVEDTNTTREDLTALFGKKVGDLVHAVSGEGKSRKERNESVYKKLALYPEAIDLKLADRIANVRSSKSTNPGLYAMYTQEWPQFEARLRNLGGQVVMWAALATLFDYD